VQLHNVFDTPTHLHIVIELATGGELFDRIIHRGHYSECDAAELVMQVGSALQYIHAHGVTHRDLKPENLLYANALPNAPIKITDFGCDARRAAGATADARSGLATFHARGACRLAKLHMDGDSVMTTSVGTPGYAAPEVISGKDYGPEVDVWSLGVILYILLCGYPPFVEDDTPSLFRKIMRAEFDFPSPGVWDQISNGARASERRRGAPLRPWPGARTALSAHSSLLPQPPPPPPKRSVAPLRRGACRGQGRSQVDARARQGQAVHGRAAAAGAMGQNGDNAQGAPAHHRFGPAGLPKRPAPAAAHGGHERDRHGAHEARLGRRAARRAPQLRAALDAPLHARSVRDGEFACGRAGGYVEPGRRGRTHGRRPLRARRTRRRRAFDRHRLRARLQTVYTRFDSVHAFVCVIRVGSTWF